MCGESILLTHWDLGKLTRLQHDITKVFKSSFWWISFWDIHTSWCHQCFNLPLTMLPVYVHTFPLIRLLPLPMANTALFLYCLDTALWRIISTYNSFYESFRRTLPKAVNVIKKKIIHWKETPFLGALPLSDSISCACPLSVPRHWGCIRAPEAPRMSYKTTKLAKLRWQKDKYVCMGTNELLKDTVFLWSA